jgi:hypothetical protein
VSLKDWVINQFLKLNIMLKNILKLNGAQQLSKNDQKSINGGACPCYNRCGPGYICVGKCGCQRVCPPNVICADS